MTSSDQEKPPVIFVLMMLLVIPLSGFGVDIYLPSMPEVRKYFQVERHWIQLSLSIYLLGVSVMQILAGPISDKWGRRGPFLISIFVFTVASFLIPMIHKIHYLLMLRFIQGLAVAATIVPIRSVASDIFSGEKLNRVATYMVLAWSAGPIVAPLVGGYLQHYFGWQGCFYFLAIYAFIIFIIGFIFLPETSKVRQPIHPLRVLKRFYRVLSTPQFDLGITLCGILYSLVIIFSTVGPFLILVDLEYAPIQFGHMALMLGLCWFCGILANRWLIRINLRKKEMVSLMMMIATAFIMLLVASLVSLNLYIILIPTFIIFFFAAIIFASVFASSFTIFPDISASASSIFISKVFLMSSIAGSFATYLKGATVLPLASTYVVLLLIGLLIARSMRLD